MHHDTCTELADWVPVYMKFGYIVYFTVSWLTVM